MRLICPNCDAQYEVDDAAIPAAGRDVQCSSCGHGWFQVHPDVETERAAESALHDAPPAAADVVDVPSLELSDLDESPVTGAMAAVDAPVTDDSIPSDGTADPFAPEASTEATPDVTPEVVSDIAPEILSDVTPDVAPETADAPDNAVTAIAEGTPQARQIDEAVLAVLREEAEREMIARRLEAEAAIETQGDLGIDNAAAAPAKSAGARHIARMKGEDPDAPPEHDPEPELKRELSRREMLPDIEEINYSLRPGEVAVDDDGEAYEIVRRPAPRSGFRSGFVLMLVLAMLIIAVYVMAPRISAQIPGAKPALDAYVAGVDSARTWLDDTTRSVVTSLRGLAGTDSPP